MTLPTGLAAYPITPADASGNVDFTAVRRLVARLVDAKVDAIGLLGSTGAYMYLSPEERQQALEAALDEIGGRVPVLVGVGALRTDDAVRLAQHAKAAGASVGLLSPVSYTPLSDDEVFEHFSAVAGESGLPICIYDNSGTTHFRFTPELIDRLAKVSGIVGVKNPGWAADDAAGHLAEQRALASKGFSIGCSTDWTAAATMIAGADLWHSVLAGILPDICLKLVRAAQRGEADETHCLDRMLAPFWHLFEQHSSLRVSYTIAGLLGLTSAEPPRPILPLSQGVKRQVADALACLQRESAATGVGTL
ncbi:dihydrodipicolinate synthase family protein [Novosphingobium album (ex Liu et al. 2023)]|uniref:Dihydrodipicolinate synthase family protein n=1 Tax=Novosphingobium album (ex Liu et al. 2023) TaxID=3031130 RepID=A0ABT5WXY0_9SPHN|nr:dihydrodipicolinate synthase family protein [Novosphingobium album (ex Liu et al. 2023)]MDE8654711.1 dihydrodipicolinate synthase family protein [Novosphingobium album (ex Liu et al. 2023)]